MATLIEMSQSLVRFGAFFHSVEGNPEAGCIVEVAIPRKVRRLFPLEAMADLLDERFTRRNPS